MEPRETLKMKAIDSKNISVIIQGLYNPKITPLCLKSIKKHLPEAEVILSLSEQPVEALATDGIDKLIINEKSQIFPDSPEKNTRFNNVNPQIISTVAGLKAATQPYALKIRTDFWLKSADFLKYFDKCPKSDLDYKIFNHKVVDCAYFARQPKSYAFHPSDIALFGETTDLLNLFDVPLMTEKESNWQGICCWRYVPEQHIFINCLRKNGKKVDYDCLMEPITKKNIIETEKYFASNFIFLSFRRFGLVPADKFYDIEKNKYKNCFTYVEGLRLYQKYIDPGFKIDENDVERKFINGIRTKPSCKFIARIISLFFIGKKNKGIRRKIRSTVPALLCKIMLKGRL